MRIAKKYRSLLTAACVLAAFLIGGSFVPNFLKPANFLNVIRQCSIIAICAVGVTQVIVIKGIDLSVGGNVTFCGMLAGLLLGMGVPVPLAILAALAAGLLIGLISGVLHAYLEVPAFIATLVIGQITQGASYLFNDGRSFGGFPEGYVFLGNGSLLGIPISDYIMVVFVLAGIFVTTKTAIGTHKGEVHILMGENGAGKSTLMKVLGGIIPPDEGEILLDGERVQPRNAREALALGIGFIHQELNLCGNLTVTDNIFMGREIVRRGVKDKKAMRAEAKRLLEEMGIHIDPNVLVKELSTAQQQIIEIAKVLSCDCRIIIMDEPTSSLTKNEIDILFTLIDRLRAQGVSIIYISHRLEEFERVGDRLSVLRDGQYIGTLEKKDFQVDTIVNMMVGRTLGAMYQTSMCPQTKPCWKCATCAWSRIRRRSRCTLTPGKSSAWAAW